MANGDVKKINEKRIAIEVDDMSYVIDLRDGQEQVEVVAAFMAKWSEKHARDKKLIAATEARRRRVAAEKRRLAVDAVMEMSDEEIEVLAEPAKKIAFAFDGFEDVPEMPVREEVKNVDTKPDRVGSAIPGGRVESESKLGDESSRPE